MIPGKRKSLLTVAETLVISRLERGACGRNDLAAELNITTRHADRILTRLRHSFVIGVLTWTKDGKVVRPVYALGVVRECPRPGPETHATHMARYWAKKREQRQALEAKGLVFDGRRRGKGAARALRRPGAAFLYGLPGSPAAKSPPESTRS